MGFELIKPGTNIDFLRYRKIAYIVSGLVILLGIGSLIMKGGPRYGVDFAGGLTIQAKFAAKINPDDIKSALDPLNLPGLVVQSFGPEKDNTYLIRAAEQAESQDTVRSQVSEALKSRLNGAEYEIQRVEMVGPKVGADLRSKALEAIFYAVLLIAIYISGRFEQRWLAAGLMAAGLGAGIYLLERLNTPMSTLILAATLITLGLCWYLKLKYALGAVVADIHDVMITVGVFSLLNIEFDLTIVAALLTILGYSLNDTIIVYDRIRENLRDPKHQGMSFERIINDSINQTLSRTILTSSTTLVVSLCLFFLGGSVIHDFALAIILGILTGTYSSVFVASPILLDLGKGFVAKTVPVEPAEVVEPEVKREKTVHGRRKKR